MSYGLFQPPVGKVENAFYCILYVIGQIAKEIDTRAFLQLINADGILGTHSVCIFLVLHPVADGCIAAIYPGELASIAQNGHVEIIRTNQIPAAPHHLILTLRDGASLYHIERIAEG